MAIQKVRIYPGLAPESNIIGFSGGVTDIPDKSEFAEFMSEKGYQTSELPPEDSPMYSGSYRHIEVKPPIEEEHLQELGALCLNIADGYHDGVAVLDNRTQPPTVNYDVPGYAPVLIAYGA